MVYNLNIEGQPPAEFVEKRPRAEWNTGQPAVTGTQGPESASSGLSRVREAARRDSKLQFSNLLHHMTVDLLRHSSYISDGKEELVTRDMILGLLTGEGEKARERYKAYVESGLGEDLKSPMEKVYGGMMLGGVGFIREVLNRLENEQVEGVEVSHRKALRASDPIFFSWPMAPPARQTLNRFCALLYLPNSRNQDAAPLLLFLQIIIWIDNRAFLWNAS
jgi:hypothetical protein